MTKFIKKFQILAELLTPMVHGSTNNMSGGGNTKTFYRHTIINEHGDPISVPTLSGNAVRSVLLRVPLWTHFSSLALARGLKIDNKASVTMLANGGNLAKAEKEVDDTPKAKKGKKDSTEPDIVTSMPSNVHSLGRDIMADYPQLELLGGCTPFFLLPESAVKPVCTLVAKEYLPTIMHIAPDLVSEAQKTQICKSVSYETHTQKADKNIFTHETLAPSIKALIGFYFNPNASDMALSAAGFAVRYWEATGAFFGGSSSNGHGQFKILENDLPSGEMYEAYINENFDRLANGLIDGTLCTGKVLCNPK